MRSNKKKEPIQYKERISCRRCRQCCRCKINCRIVSFCAIVFFFEEINPCIGFWFLISLCVSVLLHRHFCLSLECCSVNQCNKRIISLIRVSAFVMPLHLVLLDSFCPTLSIAFLIKLNLFHCHSNWEKETRPIQVFFLFFFILRLCFSRWYCFFLFAQNKYVYFVICLYADWTCFQCSRFIPKNDLVLVTSFHIVLEFSA